MSVNHDSSSLVSAGDNQPVQKPRPRSHRRLPRLALGLAGLAAGILGQIFFFRNSLWYGLLLYFLAVILFSYALASRVDGKSQPAGRGWPHALSLAEGWRLGIGVLLILVAYGTSFVAFYFFGDANVHRPAWWLYLGGLALFVSGGVLLTRSAPWRVALKSLLPTRTIALGLVVVLGIAIFMRMYNFGSQPFGVWYDEAVSGLEARHMLRDPTYRPIFLPPSQPIHLPALYALSIHWLGDTIYSMRLVSVLLGLGGVLAAYLCGYELRGPRFGLTLAFLVAVARWHVNFSRIAMTGIDVPFFEFLSLFFLVRLVKRGRLQDAMWAGLCLGSGLVFYSAFRLFVAALVIFGLLAALFWRRHLLTTLQDGGWQAHVGRIAMIVIAIWLIVLPVARFAQDNPDTFWDRTRQVSIFTKRDQPDLRLALRDNTLKHVLMFNFKGDPNGRHNLPGEPMLDPAMAILAVLGFGLALTRIGDPANAFFLVLFPTALLGGILSVDFEAPQSLRSIAAFPALIYFIGLALAILGREAEDSLKPPSNKIWLVGSVGILASFMIFYNAYTYFVRQANDFASWVSFSTPETISARRMAELGTDYMHFVSPFLINHPVLRYLAPDIDDQRPLIPSISLPIREQPERPVALLIHTEDAEIYEQAQRLYPKAGFEVISSPGVEVPGTPTLYFVDLQPANLAAIQGLELSYLRRDAEDHTARWEDQLTPSILQTEQALTVKTAWPSDGPIGTDFVAEWDGILYVPRYGPYGLRLVTPGPGLLEIDGSPVFDGQGEQTSRILLAEGNHSIQVRAQSAAGQVALYWEPPGEPETLIPQWALYVPPITSHGLHGVYYPNDRWEGKPALERIDPVLDAYFHVPPLNRPYTVEWTGVLEAPQDGIYRLGLEAVTEAQLILNGQLLVTGTELDQYIDVPINLTAGQHDIEVRFKDSTNRSEIHLSWTTPDGTFEPIPTEHLWPHQDRSPEPVPTISEAEVKPVSLSWLTTLGILGSEPGRFSEPRDVAVLANGDVVVADTANRRVQIVNPAG